MKWFCLAVFGAIFSCSRVGAAETESYTFIGIYSWAELSKSSVEITRSSDGGWRVERHDKYVDRESRSEKGVRSFERELSSVEQTKLLRLIKEADYWSMPKYSDKMVRDGWSCVIKGARERSTHEVRRSSADFKDKNEPFTQLCVFMRHLGKEPGGP